MQKLGDFISEETKHVSLSTLTTDQITGLLSSHAEFSANCIMSCGNSYDPSVYAKWTGARHVNFLEIKVDFLLVGDEQIQASQKWAETMAKSEGENWVIENQFNCEPDKYQHVARQLFSNIKPTSITFGPSGYKPDCQKI